MSREPLSRRDFVRLSLVAGTSLGIPWSPHRVRAQDAAPDAAVVAAWVQTFYDQTQTLGARFQQRYVNRVYNRTDMSRGQVRFKKPGRMRFDYDEPNGKIIVSNGTRLVIYDPPDDGGGRGQYFERELDDSQLPLALSFLTGTGRMEEDFRFRLLSAEQQVFQGGQILELRSRRPTPHYSRILLYVDGRESRRGVVHRMVIVDSANNRNRFDFSEQEMNRDIEDRVFNWRPPSGARRVQP